MQAQTCVDQHDLLLIMKRGCGNSESPWRARRWSHEADSGDDHKGWEGTGAYSWNSELPRRARRWGRGVNSDVDDKICERKAPPSPHQLRRHRDVQRWQWILPIVCSMCFCSPQLCKALHSCGEQKIMEQTTGRPIAISARLYVS